MPKLVFDTSGGELPPDIKYALEQLASEYGYSLEEGRIEACSTCGFFDCVCELKKVHKKECQYLRIATLPMLLECPEHDVENCMACWPCTCGDKNDQVR
jgi:hypothetical protein